MTRLAAILPAAGMSSRMGRFKPLLPLGTGTVLSMSVRTFRAAGVERVVVVAGNRAEDIPREAEAAGAETVLNPDFEQGMFTSIQAGVRALINTSKDADHFFVLPVDIPLVRPQTARLLAQAHLDSNALVTCPTFLGERGHPPLLSRELAPMILDHDGQGGLRAVLQQAEALHPDRIREHACADAGVLADLDSPDDYEAALDRVDMDYPLPEECRALWDMRGLGEPLRGHCREVARAARLLTEAVNAGSPGERQLSEDLAVSAALVHDLAKGKPDHARVGAEILRLHGFPRAADIVAVHPDLELPPDAPLTEKELVFLADKYVQGVELVDLEARYAAKLERFGHNPEARENIQGRLERARVVRDRVQAAAGRPLMDVLGAA